MLDEIWHCHVIKPSLTYNSAHSRQYWVAPEHICRLKIFVLKHLPILEISESDKVDHDFEIQNLSQVRRTRALSLLHVFYLVTRFVCFSETEK